MNFGTALVYLSLFLSLGASVFYIKSVRGNDKDLHFSRILYYASGIIILISSILLLNAFLTNDFRYNYVYGYSSRELEWYYLLSAFWAGQPGSFLLWILLLNIFGIFIIRKNDEDEGILMAVITITQFAILLVLVVAANPFQYIWDGNPNLQPGQVPRDGSGLNPLLIDPWMIVHPPVLFLGYASASIPFAYTIAALIRNNYDKWIYKSYKWILFSLTTLGIGIFLGGYWAYKVLGWGGYWGWDPVENSSLIPWLVGVILIHGIIIQRRKKALVKTNIFLSLTYLILVFYSTYLTRSGILANFSVHSFGESMVGVFVGMFILLCITVSTYLFFKRFTDIRSKSLSEDLWSWDTLLVYGMITLGIYTFLILIGTSMPIISGIVLTNATSVTEKFYNNISVPFGVLILVLMVLSTMAVVSKEILKTKDIVVVAASLALAFFFNYNYTGKIVAYLFSAVSIFVIFQYIYDFSVIKRSSLLPSRLSHIGLGLLVLGVISSGMHSTEELKKIFLGKEDRVGPVNITFRGFTREKNASMIFTLREKSGIRRITTKYFISQKMNSLYREPYIKYGFFYDIYIIPEKYEPGTSDGDSAIIAKGQIKEIGGLKVKFLNFNTKEMTAKDPVIYANLLINGKRVSPGKKINRMSSSNIDRKIPGTDRSVSLLRINPSKGMIDIYISADEKTAPVPDSALIHVTKKRLIWIVWLGTVLITIGGFAAIYMYKDPKESEA